MSHENEDTNLTVLVTGFGAFQDIKINPSWEIVSQLPSSTTHKGQGIRIITHPAPFKAAYHDLLNVVPKLLEQVSPDIVLHMGLAVERDYFAVEKGADRDGYHQYPDVARKVFTKVENKKVWGKSPARLDSCLELENVVGMWRAGAGKGTDVRMSDDVGAYVCGFVYYLTLEYFYRKGEKEKSILFMHVPPLNGEAEIEKGKRVTLAMIHAMAECSRK
ncbi:Pyrrolidone carboxyl peptidase (Pyroglutamate aminopeptidase) [Venustampulla echinocandica]|uniref:Pyrrolidone carboxyl peptidase (Pyroglutamate aminopeptidase) n=1 Tax=Venustampulla echinocandica TaxID=2656787 RepID=A0A370TPL4_9HELO|nr:Pyrrolidone carboxyl peptidase (Pyroglutamate aminopeptidase) [Venustampulla echinocandica]RDL37452.1 Pyrrolidone carboxyl peptidase (Pyroglutamate aminopeptidase) [Venustampulla echinocandica]